MNRNWTEAEEKFIRTEAGRLSDEEMAGKLDRPVANVRKKRQRMGFAKAGGRGVKRLKACPRPPKAVE